jgi:predicted nucleic acid-binding protein
VPNSRKPHEAVIAIALKVTFCFALPARSTKQFHKLIIDYLQNDPNVAPFLQSILDDPTIPVYVSTLTEAELFSHSNLSDEEAHDTILQSVSLVPLVSNIARAAGRVRGTHRLKLADSIVASTALFTGSTLLTRNFL